MKDIEIQGKNIEAAVEMGLKKLGVDREQVDIQVLDEGKKGLFGLMGSNPAKIKMILKEGVQLNAEELHETAEKVDNEVKKIVGFMGLNLKVKTTFMGGRIYVELTGEDTSIIIGRSGQTLDALETIINLMMGNALKTKTKIVIDAEMYKARREDKLKALARNIAGDVKSTGKDKELKPMSSQERKIIHMALEHDKDVTTFSTGMGRDRKIVISPKKKRTDFN